jgi:hypothetical protein
MQLLATLAAFIAASIPLSAMAKGKKTAPGTAEAVAQATNTHLTIWWAFIAVAISMIIVMTWSIFHPKDEGKTRLPIIGLLAGFAVATLLHWHGQITPMLACMLVGAALAAYFITGQHRWLWHSLKEQLRPKPHPFLTVCTPPPTAPHPQQVTRPLRATAAPPRSLCHTCGIRTTGEDSCGRCGNLKRKGVRRLL